MTGKPLIVNLAPTGMVPTKAMTPHVPVSTAEILDEVAACVELGASIIHLHARDEHEVPTHRKEAFAPLVEGVRRIDPNLVICVTCSGRFAGELDQRAEVLELDGDAKPDMASLTLGSNNFVQQASVNSPAIIKGLAERMRERSIKPELEVFEPGMVAFGEYLVRKGLIAEPCYVNILLGNLGTSPLTPGALASFLALIPAGWTWALAGLGAFQLDANLMAIAAGGHVRVGLEDNIWYDRDRTRLATNRALLRRVAQQAELAERPLATARQVRSMLGLPLRSTTSLPASGAGVVRERVSLGRG
jgi:3-keto-5-aminohexanoate cleavage enzyme